ncbi:hypothetical protein AVEN_257620-1 [Araneus ventricosus]|uniref:Uncharacterized protein n=1 Tax=Araneus ventricosus TaxID=182803 RepID=A0A4Y2E764_ARAVE|nr:hypothetical protein AVEN_257620-1 [Araneus ventricosus]
MPPYLLCLPPPTRASTRQSPPPITVFTSVVHTLVLCVTGPIGQQLNCYEKLPVFDYEPIDCSIPDIDRNLLSKVQYLLDILNAITLGHCPEDLANREPGLLFHSRWLTAANRVLRLYISSSDPSGNLRMKLASS